MQKIEITTTQKVTIEYELASWGERLVGFVIDQFVIIMTLVILGNMLVASIAGGWLMLFMLLYVAVMVSGYIFLTGSIRNISVTQAVIMVVFILFFMVFLSAVEGMKETDALFYVFILPIWIFYSLVFESMMDGQTLGKRLMGIKVVKLTGNEPTLSDYLIRWTFRPIDIWTSGAVASLLITTSPKSQRLGDILANTAVIRMKSSMNLRFEDISRIKSLEDYEITYPNVRQFSEKDMLLVKTVLSRYSSFQNDAHKDAVLKVLSIVMQKLQITEKPKNPISFLKTVLNDYIVLTR